MKKHKRHATPPISLSAIKSVPPTMIDPNTKELVRITPAQRSAVAAIQAYGATNTAARAAGISTATLHNTFKLGAVQQYLRDQLDRAGATDEKIMKVINAGLEATTRRDGFDKSGRLLKGEERPDYSERREAAKLALRLKGLDTAPDKDEAGGVTNNTIFNIVMEARAKRGLPVEALEAEVINNPVIGDATPPKQETQKTE